MSNIPPSTIVLKQIKGFRSHKFLGFGATLKKVRNYILLHIVSPAGSVLSHEQLDVSRNNTKTVSKETLRPTPKEISEFSAHAGLIE